MHDHAGSNNNGARNGGGLLALIDCVIESSGLHGVAHAASSLLLLSGCDLYNNGGDGFNNQGNSRSWIENCNVVKNAGWGINGNVYGMIANCAFGTGTMANTSGDVQGVRPTETGKVTLPGNTSPWVDAANGDFRGVLAATRGTGRGNFLQTASGYAGSRGYPDIGS